MSTDPHSTAPLELELELDGDPTPLAERQVRDAVRSVLHGARIEGGVDVGISFVSLERIQALNAQYRGVDGPTDVLSFSLDAADALPPGMPRQLGDVIVCIDHVRGQLDRGEHMSPSDNLEAAVLRCVVHGALHLLGHLHDDEPGADRMVELEDAVLAEVLA